MTTCIVLAILGPLAPVILSVAKLLVIDSNIYAPAETRACEVQCAFSTIIYALLDSDAVCDSTLELLSITINIISSSSYDSTPSKQNDGLLQVEMRGAFDAHCDPK